MLKWLKTKLQLIVITILATVGSFFVGSTTSSNTTDYTLTIIDGSCVATTTPGSAIFYTLLGVAALPNSGVRVEVLIDKMATFKFHPCNAINLNSLISQSISGGPSSEWLFDYSKQVAYNYQLRTVVPVTILEGAFSAKDIAFSPFKVTNTAPS